MHIKKNILLALREPRYFIGRCKDRFKNIFRQGPPLKILFLCLTYGCNLKCKMCMVGILPALKKVSFDEELTLDDMKSCIDEVAGYNPCIELIGGGEPLLHKGCVKLLKYIKHKKLSSILQTNGVSLDKYAEEIVEYVNFLQVSIDASSEELHNYIRGANCFKKIWEGIKKIDLLKKGKNRRSPHLIICFTITDYNWDKIEEMANKLQSEDIEILSLSIQNNYFIDEVSAERFKTAFLEQYGGDLEIPDALMLKPSKINVDEIYKTINQLKKKNYKFSIDYPAFSLSQLKQYYNNPSSIPNRIINEYNPRERVFIFPDGDVWSCGKPMGGNIKRDKLGDIIKKDRFSSDKYHNELYMYYVKFCKYFGYIK